MELKSSILPIRSDKGSLVPGVEGNAARGDSFVFEVWSFSGCFCELVLKVADVLLLLFSLFSETEFEVSGGPPSMN